MTVAVQATHIELNTELSNCQNNDKNFQGQQIADFHRSFKQHH